MAARQRYYLTAQYPPAHDELRQKIDNREQGQMLFPHNSIQDAYNSAVITGNYALSERYAACWLWLLMAEKEQRAERRGKISPRTHIASPIKLRRQVSSKSTPLMAGVGGARPSHVEG